MKSWLGSLTRYSKCITIAVCILAATTPSFPVALSSGEMNMGFLPKEIACQAYQYRRSGEVAGHGVSADKCPLSNPYSFETSHAPAVRFITRPPTGIRQRNPTSSCEIINTLSANVTTSLQLARLQHWHRCWVTCQVTCR